MIKDKQELHQIQHIKQLSRSVKLSTPLDIRDFEEFDTEVSAGAIDCEQRSPRSCQKTRKLGNMIEEH